MNTTTIDDGIRQIKYVHAEFSQRMEQLIAICEEPTTTKLKRREAFLVANAALACDGEMLTIFDTVAGAEAVMSSGRFNRVFAKAIELLDSIDDFLAHYTTNVVKRHDSDTLH